MKNFKVAFCAALLLGVFSIPALADTTIAVTLWDNGENLDLSKNLGMAPGSTMDMTKAPMGLKAQPAEVPAGKVTFQVTNSSKATIHEMILASYAGKSKALPYIDNENRADEDKAGDLGEVSELDPGKTGSLTVEMKPGTYILFCNVPGHLGAGMWTTVKVK
jgi:uncharacterized cupredoxin-like copper-binding protein